MSLGDKRPLEAEDSVGREPAETARPSQDPSGCKDVVLLKLLHFEVFDKWSFSLQFTICVLSFPPPCIGHRSSHGNSTGTYREVALQAYATQGGWIEFKVQILKKRIPVLTVTFFNHIKHYPKPGFCHLEKMHLFWQSSHY